MTDYKQDDPNPEPERSSRGISNEQLRAGRARKLGPQAEPVAAAAPEASAPGEVQQSPEALTHTSIPAGTAHHEDGEAEPAAVSTATDKPKKQPRRRVRRAIFATLVIVVVGLAAWDVAIRAGDSEPASPPPNIEDSNSTFPKASQADIDAAIRYRTLSTTKPTTQWCPLVAHPDQCMQNLSNIPRPGLRSAVTVVQSATVPAGQAVEDGTAIASTPGTPAVAAVVVSATTGQNTAPGAMLLLLRPTDHKVITELNSLDNAQLRYSAGELALRVLKGQEPDAVNR